MAGYRRRGIYVEIIIDDIVYPAHVLAWLYVHGEIAYVDHKNRKGWYNAISNLRKATVSQNMANKGVYVNNALGVKGVRFHKGTYEARIQVNKKPIQIGCFKTLEQAAAAYKKAAELYFGEFANAS